MSCVVTRVAGGAYVLREADKPIFSLLPIDIINLLLIRLHVDYLGVLQELRNLFADVAKSLNVEYLYLRQ